MKLKTIVIAFSTTLASALLLTPSAWADPLDTWTQQTNGLPTSQPSPCGPCSEEFLAITYGDGAFVAVGTPGVGTSYDGIHWATRPLQASPTDVAKHLSSIIYNGTFFACGITGDTGASMIFTSPDATNWAEANVPASIVIDGISKPLPSLSAIAFASTAEGFLYVAVGPDGTELLSTNGMNWFQFDGIPSSDDLVGVVYGNGVFVAIGTISGNAYVSTGGEAWTAHPTGAGAAGMANITFGDGLFVAVAEDGNPISSSTDGINWVPASNQQSTVLDGWPANGIAYGKGQFIVVGAGGLEQPEIVSATNSYPTNLTWVTRFAPSSGNDLSTIGYLNAAVYANGLWVAVGAPAGFYGAPLVMTAGKLVSIKSETYPGVFKQPIVGSTFNFSNLTLLYRGLVAVGDDGTIVTFGGGTPQLHLTSTTNQLRGVVAALSAFVAVGSEGTILSSVDATNWTEVPSPTTNLLYGVSSGNGLDVAVGANGTVLTSDNDTTWTNAPAPGTNTLIGITFGSGEFEALSTNGEVLLSTNGAAWTTNFIALPAQASPLMSISFAGGLFSGTDSNGDVLTSSDGIHWDLLVTGSSATAGIDTASLVNGTLVMLGKSDTVLTVQFPVVGTGTTANLYAVAYNGTTYVAVGEAGTIITSLDASAWTAPTNYVATANTLSGITYGGGLFVGVGEGGWIVTSPDGENWTSASSGATVATLNAVAYGAGQFVAVGDSGTIITSSDGFTWATAVSGDTSTLQGIAFAKGMFAVSDVSGDSLVSTDGVHWKAGANSLDSDVDGVAEGNGVWVIVDQNGVIYSSTDGTNWVDQAAPQMGLFGVACGDGIFVATGANGTMLVSPNGTNWTQVQTSATNQYLYGAVFGNSQFVMVGTDGTVVAASLGALASLPPATTWNLVNSQVTGTLNSVAFNGQVYAVVSSDYASDVDSTDGVTWTSQGIGLEGDNLGVIWGDGTFVTVDGLGGIYTSPDGTNWTGRASTGVGLNAVAFGGGVYVAASSTGEVFTSSDSIHWLAHPTGSSSFLTALTYAKGQFVVVATDGSVITSPNGTTWTSQSSPATESLYAITYANGLFVAVGESGTIITSPDSIDWTLQTNAPIAVATLDGIAWGNNEFMAVGSEGWTIRSGDGINWISSSSATVNDLNAIIFANGRFLAVGVDGTIIETPGAISSHFGPITLLPGRGIQITLQGTPNSSYSIQVSTNLVNWTTLAGLSLSGTNAVQFIDSAAMSPDQPHRFYRAVLAP